MSSLTKLTFVLYCSNLLGYNSFKYWDLAESSLYRDTETKESTDPRKNDVELMLLKPRIIILHTNPPSTRMEIILIMMKIGWSWLNPMDTSQNASWQNVTN